MHYYFRENRKFATKSVFLNFIIMFLTTCMIY